MILFIEVKPLPELYLNEDDICLGEESYTLNAMPEGGTYYIDGVKNNFFDVENLDFGDYIIKYEYTDPITLCSNTTEDVITISDSPIAAMNLRNQLTLKIQKFCFMIIVMKIFHILNGI